MFPDITVREMLATGILHQLRPRLTCAARTEGRVLQDCLQHISLDDRPDARLLDSPCRPTFSSRDAYRAIQGEALEQDAMRIWATWLPTKVKFFSWLLVRGRLNTRAYLHHRNIRTLEDSWCVHCNGVSETDVHIFSGCRRAQEVWSRLGVSVQAGLVRRPWDIGAGIPLPDAVRVDAIVLILWHLWKARNAAIFDNANSNSTDVLCRVARDLASWASR